MRSATPWLTGTLVPVVMLAAAWRPIPPDRSSVHPIQSTPSAPLVTSSQDYTFPTGAGILFFYVKPDRTVDFESVVARLSDALNTASDPQLKQQAAGWHILRSVETIKDAAMYVFVFDPAVVGADYDPVKVLGQVLPAELQGLYAKLKDTIIRVERMGLVKLR